MSKHHTSVLLNEWLAFLQGRNLIRYVDGTLGAGGHAEGVLASHPEIQQFIGIDQDPMAHKLSKERLAPWSEKLTLLRGNFGDMGKLLPPSDGVDAILLDIGVSSMQLDQAERGFSFMRDGPLDMRMDPEGKVTAADIVNTYSEEDLAKIFRDYGEEKQWRRAAAAVVEARDQEPFTTTFQLANVLKSKLITLKHKKIHPATLVFQGLRIAVNGELDVLERAIPAAFEALKPGGVLGIITFHSLEDRIVKRAFQEAASDKVSTRGIAGVFQDKEPLVKLLTRKPVKATSDEIDQNPRSRSARLRVVEKLG